MTSPLPFHDNDQAAGPSGDLYTLLSDKSPLQLMAHLFQVSDALRGQSHGIHETHLASLKALYQVLCDQYGYDYFARYTDCSLDVLYNHLASFGGQEDPLKQSLADVHRVLWEVYYRDFCDDPYATIAEWDPQKIHQTRAIRSGLFQIHYVELLRLTCVMNVSCQEVKSETEEALHDIIRLKYEEILSVLYHREETSAEFSKALKFLDMKKQSQSLRAVLICLEKANRIYS
jgi:hypothetical protein